MASINRPAASTELTAQLHDEHRLPADSPVQQSTTPLFGRVTKFVGDHKVAILTTLAVLSFFTGVGSVAALAVSAVGLISIGTIATAALLAGTATGAVGGLGFACKAANSGSESRKDYKLIGSLEAPVPRSTQPSPHLCLISNAFENGLRKLKNLKVEDITASIKNNAEDITATALTIVIGGPAATVAVLALGSIVAAVAAVVIVAVGVAVVIATHRHYKKAPEAASLEAEPESLINEARPAESLNVSAQPKQEILSTDNQVQKSTSPLLGRVTKFVGDHKDKIVALGIGTAALTIGAPGALLLLGVLGPVVVAASTVAISAIAIVGLLASSHCFSSDRNAEAEELDEMLSKAIRPIENAATSSAAPAQNPEAVATSPAAANMTQILTTTAEAFNDEDSDDGDALLNPTSIPVATPVVVEEQKPETVAQQPEVKVARKITFLAAAAGLAAAGLTTAGIALSAMAVRNNSNVSLFA